VFAVLQVGFSRLDDLNNVTYQQIARASRMEENEKQFKKAKTNTMITWAERGLEKSEYLAKIVLIAKQTPVATAEPHTN